MISTALESTSAPASAYARWAGHVFSILPCLLFFYSSIGVKFVQPPGTQEHFAALGWSMDRMMILGVVELASAVIYLIPRTAMLGAILLTAYLGGAIATHVRVGENVVFQIVLGLSLWLGLYLRNPRLRALFPFQR